MVSRFLKLGFSIGVIGTFAAGGALILLAPLGDYRRRRIRSTFTHLLCRLMVKALGIRTKVPLEDRQKLKNQSGALWIANHTSVLDIIILAAQSPCVFITSVETEETFGLSFLARTGGTLFVERRSRSQILSDQKNIQNVIAEGFNVVLFPEGTSTNGTDVLRFKSGLFPAATQVSAPIVPIAIQYLTLAGKPISNQNRDQIFYYGDHKIENHLFRIFTNPTLEVKLSVLETIPTSPETNVKPLAQTCQAMIRNRVMGEFSECARPLPLS